MVMLEQLKQTAENLAEKGFDVEIRGEGIENGQGELTISRSDIGKDIPAENKNLNSNKANKAQANVAQATKQAGDGGTVIIDGKQSGMTVETFEQGLESFKRTSIPRRLENGTSGTSGKIIFIDAEGKFL